jgi:hypothetical protein
MGARCDPIAWQPFHWHAGPVARFTVSSDGFVRKESKYFESSFIFPQVWAQALSHTRLGRSITRLPPVCYRANELDTCRL